MDGGLVHYEVFVRKNPTSRWVLELATDQPHIALATAEDLVKGGQVAAAMVTQETFDEDARVFHSETLFKENTPDAKRKADLGDWNPLCSSPADLYAERGRERIATLVEGWLARKHVTCFELLHDAHLVEQLEAAATEMQHAVQKFAIAEVQIRGGVTHEMIRRIQRLLDQATDRLNAHAKRGAFPKIAPNTFAASAELLQDHPDKLFLLGGGVAQALALAHDWDQKVRVLLDLLDAAPADGPARKLALAVLDQPLSEIVLSRAGLAGIVGDCDDLAGDLSALTRLISAEAVAKVAAHEPAVLKVMPQLSGEAERLSEKLTAGIVGDCDDLAGDLSALTRLISAEAVAKVAAHEPAVLKVMPQLSGEAERLSEKLTGEELKGVRAAAARRVLADLHGHKRLRPSNAAGEIEALRALVLSLTAATGGLLPEEDVMAALAARSRSLLSSDFLDAYLQDIPTAEREARALLWLAANVVGAANKRRAARLVQGAVFSLKFETEMLENGAATPTARLAVLAGLQREAARCGLVREDAKAIHERLGQLGGRLEDKSQLLGALAKAQAPAVKKLQVLLRLASGETAPLGPAAERARDEALRLVRDEGVRAELARDEGQMSAVRDLIRDAGLAA